MKLILRLHFQEHVNIQERNISAVAAQVTLPTRILQIQMQAGEEAAAFVNLVTMFTYKQPSGSIPCQYSKNTKASDRNCTLDRNG